MGPCDPFWVAAQPRHRVGILLFWPPSSSGALGNQTQPYRNFSPQEGSLPQSIPSPALPPPTLQNDREPQALAGKRPSEADVGQALSPGSASQLGDLGEVTFSNHSSTPCSDKGMSVQVKSQRPGRSFPWASTPGSRNMPQSFSLGKPSTVHDFAEQEHI